MKSPIMIERKNLIPVRVKFIEGLSVIAIKWKVKPIIKIIRPKTKAKGEIKIPKINWWNLMRIAILTPTFNYHSGIDRVVQLQAEEYVKKRDRVSVIALKAKIKSNKY